MTFHADVDALKQRILKAEAEREAWRISGRQENYLAACSTVDALDAQLAALQRDQRRDAAQSRGAAPSVARSGQPSATPEQLMAKLHIDFNGRSYQYRSYRYDRLADAVNYARLDRALPFSDLPAVAARSDPTAQPSDIERELMRRNAITFEDGVFRWRGYRYDRLADAIAYASLAPPKNPSRS
ncbi:MAG TPA: hypothetical protein VIV54_12965 [Burkholderiales bacterium]